MRPVPAKKAGGNYVRVLLDRYEYGGRRAVDAEEQAPARIRARRATFALSAEVRLKTGRVEGVEALLRWDLARARHRVAVGLRAARRGDESDPAARRLGAQSSLRGLSFMAATRAVAVRVSVNLSLRQLQQRRFLDQVRETFRSHGVSPTSLELEITETTLMEDPERTIRILDALYGMGLHLAIDDFGTGYSSLSALQQFPINTLKIDQSFVTRRRNRRDDAAIVDAIIQMAHSLELEVVAEGVEDRAAARFPPQAWLRLRAGPSVRRPGDGRQVRRAADRGDRRQRQVPRALRLSGPRHVPATRLMTLR